MTGTSVSVHRVHIITFLSVRSEINQYCKYIIIYMFWFTDFFMMLKALRCVRLMGWSTEENGNTPLDETVSAVRSSQTVRQWRRRLALAPTRDGLDVVSVHPIVLNVPENAEKLNHRNTAVNLDLVCAGSSQHKKWHKKQDLCMTLVCCQFAPQAGGGLDHVRDERHLMPYGAVRGVPVTLAAVLRWMLCWDDVTERPRRALGSEQRVTPLRWP